MSGSRRLEPRAAAARVAATLREAGFETYFAGGCVRDHLFGIEPADVDVATAARPEDVRSHFPHARGVGAHFGVMLVPSGGRMIEVATFRSDGAYHDGRRPVEVSFGSAEADARRRDFTINGLFEDPESGRIIDFVGGRADLDAGVLRAIGDPEERFEEDRLRMLRAVRFAARFELEIDPATFEAIRRRADRLGAVSRERVGHELRRMLGHRSRAVAAARLESLGLDRAVLGADRTVGGRAAASELTRLRGLEPTADWEDALAAWEIDRGGVDVDPESILRMADRVTERLVLSNQEHDDLVEVLRIRGWLQDGWGEAGVALRKRWASRSGFGRALALLEPESPDLVAVVRRDVARLAESGLAPTPLVGGDDLVAAGLRPGPAFREILDSVYDRQLEGGLADRDAALAAALALATEIARQSRSEGGS